MHCKIDLFNAATNETKANNTCQLFMISQRQALLHNSNAATNKHERCTLTEQKAV